MEHANNKLTKDEEKDKREGNALQHCNKSQINKSKKSRKNMIT